VLACVLCGALSLAGASGCAFSRGDLGTPFKDSDVAAIKKGHTTQGEVVALLGAPDTIKEINHQEVFHYYRYTLKHGTVLVFTRVNVAGDDLYVFFDREGVVDRVLFGKQTPGLKFQYWPFGK
jgi:outer membrane protein assembly factor BamE (lipoprotein component of BamABCDE complex)